MSVTSVTLTKALAEEGGFAAEGARDDAAAYVTAGFEELLRGNGDADGGGAHLDAFKTELAQLESLLGDDTADANAVAIEIKQSIESLIRAGIDAG